MTDTTTTETLPEEEQAKEIAQQFLLGEMIKACTKHLKTVSKPWIDMKEHEQERILHQVKTDCFQAIQGACDLIAANARLVLNANVTQVTFKDGVKAQLELLNSPAAHALADVVGSMVKVVIEDRGSLLEVGDAMDTEPDQPPLFDQSTDEKIVH